MKQDMSREEIVEVMAEAINAEDARRDGMPLKKLEAEPRDFRHALAHAALAALEENGLVLSEGWRPIETAPKDGTNLIVFTGIVQLAAWRKDDNMTEEPAQWLADAIDWNSRGWASQKLKPTHWRELPAPPAAAIPGKE